ncbi:glycosyltransferase family 1 protein [Aliarcobacter skirrowii]|uniref:glycosyltransferase family 4 protein n=1 Tax=Aliarcobacter skirrowii TaxID=28200 RepID=UPI000F6699EA|nr:glycosyltransferase family 1 protein [Aliarcobacter skirrowii]AZL54035.1 glycosyltransferase family 1 protein [Aliarcobacter skirrowii]
MKISIVLLNFSFEGVDGIGNYAYRTILNLSMNKNLTKLTIFIELENLKYIENKEWFQFDNVEIKTFILPKNRYFRAIYKFIIPPIDLFKSKYDRIIYVAPPVNLLTLLFLNVTTVIHDITPLIVKRKQSLLFKTYFFIMVWIVLKLSKKIICISESTKLDLMKYFKIFDKKIIISYNNIPKIKFTKSSNIKKYFLAVSTIQPGKNIENLIKSFSIFKQEYNLDFKLIIVGKYGWGPKEIYDLPRALNIEDNVEFKGYVSENELNILYSEAWALINISKYEGFGLPVLEAMYYNCPSIISEVSALPEVAGKTAIHVNPFNVFEISKALYQITDEKFRDTLTKEIPKQLLKFDPVENGRKFFE